MLARSLQILANSAEGILTIAWYSASGIPRCSLSMSINFISKSAILSCAIVHCKKRNKKQTNQSKLTANNYNGLFILCPNTTKNSCSRFEIE
jgi:hypothetical protein